jgi:hypothetical protein
MIFRIASFVVALACLLVGTPAGAQDARYPNVDRPLALAPGDTVHVLIRFVNEGGPNVRPPGRRLDFVYSTRIPAGNASARVAQADRAAQLFGPAAIEIGARRLSIGICDTRECAERRHPPGEWYLYERTNDGWRRLR